MRTAHIAGIGTGIITTGTIIIGIRSIPIPARKAAPWSGLSLFDATMSAAHALLTRPAAPQTLIYASFWLIGVEWAEAGFRAALGTRRPSCFLHRILSFCAALDAGVFHEAQTQALHNENAGRICKAR